MENILEDKLFNLITLILAIAGIVFSFIFYFKSKRKKNLNFFLSQFN